jgi:hypothetical protein
MESVGEQRVFLLVCVVDIYSIAAMLSQVLCIPMSKKKILKFYQVQKKKKKLECRFISGISEKILRQRNGFALISNGQFFFGDYFGKTFF